MRQFFSGYLLFATNAALVMGLIALSSALQTSSTSTQPTSKVSSTEGMVELSSPQPDVVAAPQSSQTAPVVKPVSAPQSVVQPHVRAREYEDDD
jgi:hypothetical protein